MNKIAFVILNYCTFSDTVECINSVKDKIDADDYEIVIVDNASPDGSGQQLRERYKGVSKITILHNESNLGYACGNNVGFRYAKNVLDCNFIVILNSDVLLLSANFFRMLLN